MVRFQPSEQETLSHDIVSLLGTMHTPYWEAGHAIYKELDMRPSQQGMDWAQVACGAAVAATALAAVVGRPVAEQARIRDRIAVAAMLRVQHLAAGLSGRRVRLSARRQMAPVVGDEEASRLAVIATGYTPGEAVPDDGWCIVVVEAAVRAVVGCARLRGGA